MTVGLLEACDDSALFGFDLWPRQRELLEAVEKGPRIHIWALGRRSGKTTLAALTCLHSCLFRPDLDAKVRRGERRYAVAVATNLQQARLLVQAARSIVEESPTLADLVQSITDDEIVFTTPDGQTTVLRAFPCSSRGGRGWPISTLCMDECAHFLTETEGPATAQRVWTALFPSTAQFGGGARVIVSSTPFGNAGLFADLFNQAKDRKLEDAVAHHATTREVNPTIDQAFLDREQARDPDSFRGEYLAEFLASGGAFLDWDRIQAAVNEDRFELSPTDVGIGHGAEVVAALDVAFSKDPFAAAIVARDLESPDRLRLVAVRSWRPKGELAFAPVLDEVAELCERFHVSQVHVDQFCSAPVRQYLAGKGIHATEVTTTASSKISAYSDLKSKLYAGELELYRHEGLLAELGRVEVHYAGGGTASIRIPRVGGSHGDLAQALALAVHKLAQRPSGSSGGAIRTGRWLPESAV